jgi:UDP-glucose 4-epimerase
VAAVIAARHDAIILGAAITAGPEREASDPESILRVNLLAQTPIWSRREAAALTRHQPVVRGRYGASCIPERAAR